MFSCIKTQAEWANFILFFALSFVNEFVFMLGAACLTRATFLMSNQSPCSLQCACLVHKADVLLMSDDGG